MRLRSAAVAAVAAASMVVLSACGSSSDSSGASGASSASGLAHAQSEVAGHLEALTTFKAPGGAVTGLSQFRGRTIAYIPITLQATYFQAELEQITQAAAPLGIKVQVCDAEVQPTVATQCLNQAVAAKSAGIITDSLSFALARNAYAAAVKAQIPVVASDVTDPVPAEWADYVLTTNNGQDTGSRLMADAIIADSKGSANVLFVNTVTTTTTKQSSDAVQDEFKTQCPGCTVKTVAWQATAVQKIPTAVSVALNADPNIRYVFVSYDQPAGPPTIQGMKLSRQANQLKLVGYGADISAMQRIKAGSQFVDVANDPAQIAWNNTDRLFRMMTKSPVPAAAAYLIPRRIFNSSNVGTVDGGNVADFKSGAWFTDGTYRQAYEKLWAGN